MNIIFLDVDGVLNSERSFMAGGERIKQYEIDQPNDPYWLKITMCTIDPVACDMINRLCKTCDAKIVVSSTHRKHFADNGNKLWAMKEYFRNLGVKPEYIIDWTENLSTPRGVEIQDWLERHPETSRYIIIDDSSDMLDHQMEYFVRCDGAVGFSADNLRQSMSLLGREESMIVTL